MNMEIADIKKINLNPGETIVVQMDTGSMPPNRVNAYLNQVADTWRKIFPDPTIGIVVINHNTSLTVISSEPKLEIVNTLSIEPSTLLPAISQDDYERAMGVIK